MSPPPSSSEPHHSHRLFVPQASAAVLFGALGARGAPLALGGGAVGRCLGLVTAKDLGGVAEGGDESAETNLVAVSIEGPAAATAAAAAEMLSVARRAAEATAAAASRTSNSSDADGGEWTYCDERGVRRGPFPWPQVLKWARRGFWQPGFPLRDGTSGAVMPSALAVAAMEFLAPSVAASVAAAVAASATQQQQRHQQQHQPTAMATEAAPLAVPANPRPSPVVHHVFAREEEMTTTEATTAQQRPKAPQKAKMALSDALSILGRRPVAEGGGGGGSGRGKREGRREATAALPSAPAAAFAPAIAAYGAAAPSPPPTVDPRSLAAELDAAVVSSLAPAVATRLRGVHGDLWLDVLPVPLPWKSPDDVFSVVQSTWRSTFESGYPRERRARAEKAVESLPRALRAARSSAGGGAAAVLEAASSLAEVVRDFPCARDDAAATAAALARVRAAAASVASRAASMT